MSALLPCLLLSSAPGITPAAPIAGFAFAQPRARTVRGATVHADLNYAGTENKRQTLDVLVPEKPKADKLPLIVFIHGGAWRAGNKNAGYRWLPSYVQSGNYVCATINYRLTNEAMFPAQIHDVKAAIRFLRGNAKKFVIDKTRIAVMGTSAGGHLVALLGTSGGVAKLEGKLGNHTAETSTVQAVVNFFGPTDFTTIGKYPSRIKHNEADSPEGKLIGGAIPKNLDKAKAVSPVTYITKDDPPILTIHGTKDPLVPVQQGEEFHTALKKAGVDSTFIKIEGGGHGGFKAKDYRERMNAFLAKHLKVK